MQASTKIDLGTSYYYFRTLSRSLFGFSNLELFLRDARYILRCVARHRADPSVFIHVISALAEINSIFIYDPHAAAVDTSHSADAHFLSAYTAPVGNEILRGALWLIIRGSAVVFRDRVSDDFSIGSRVDLHLTQRRRAVLDSKDNRLSWPRNKTRRGSTASFLGEHNWLFLVVEEGEMIMTFLVIK